MVGDCGWKPEKADSGSLRDRGRGDPSAVRPVERDGVVR